jgi:glutamate synthase (ferredoxin)
MLLECNVYLMQECICLELDVLLYLQVNTEIVALQRVKTAAGAAQLRGLIETHVEKTGSEKGKAILASWEKSLEQFWQIVPPAEKNTPEVNPDLVPQEPVGKVVLKV